MPREEERRSSARRGANEAVFFFFCKAGGEAVRTQIQRDFMSERETGSDRKLSANVIIIIISWLHLPKQQAAC